jgi:oxygen-independent coproporphyrinogen III oxidase
MTTKSHARFCIDDSLRNLQESYALLPSDYFKNKNALTYRFNNISRLFTDRHRQASTPPQSMISDEILEHDGVALYAGVPWCEQICAFCNFAYSKSNDPNVFDQYIARINDEMVLYIDMGVSKVYSVYFGGGTPTILDEGRLSQYLQSVLTAVTLSDNASVTCEATVNTLTREKIEVMREAGVTRLSMGIQSLDDDVRSRARLLGSADEAIATLQVAHSYFDMLNIDLIYGYPYQTPESWFDTVSRIAEMAVPSLTLYRLEVKPGTLDLKHFQDDSTTFLDELSARHLYFIARTILEEAGYVESPLGWWILHGEQNSSLSWKQHMAGWEKVVPYIGVGQGGFSTYRSLYYENHKQHKTWQTLLDSGTLPVDGHFLLPPSAPLLMRVFRTLRTARGIDVSVLRQLSNDHRLVSHINRTLEECAKKGLFDNSGEEYRLTVAGRSLIHWILDDLIPDHYQ